MDNINTHLSATVGRQKPRDLWFWMGGRSGNWIGNVSAECVGHGTECVTYITALVCSTQSDAQI